MANSFICFYISSNSSAAKTPFFCNTIERFTAVIALRSPFNTAFKHIFTANDLKKESWGKSTSGPLKQGATDLFGGNLLF